MRFYPALKRIALTILGCFLLQIISLGQNLSFRNFGSEYGIPDGFVYTINQSDNGFLWVGTGTGFSRFDGFNYYYVPYPDSAMSRVPAVSFKDKAGTLWFGCSDGTVFFSTGFDLSPVKLQNTRSISQILQGPDGLVYIVSQGKTIFSIDPEKHTAVNQFQFPEEHTLLSAVFSHSGELLLGTQGKILVCNVKTDTVTIGKEIDGFDYSGVTALCGIDGEDAYVVGTEDNGLFSLKATGSEYTLSRFENHPEWDALNVKSVSTDSDKQLWVSTFGSGVIQFSLSDNARTVNSVQVYNDATGLPSNDTKLVFQDLEGDYWFGFFGEGVSMLTSYAFVHFTPGRNSSENNILFVSSLDDKYILGTPGGIHLFDLQKGRTVSFTDLTRSTGGAAILSYNMDNQKNLWIGTDGNGLYQRDRNGSVKLFYRSGDSGLDKINDIQLDEKNIWLATTNGLIVLDRQRRTEKARFGTNNGLPVNFIRKIILSGDKAFVGADIDRLYYIDSDLNIGSYDCLMTGSTKNKIFSFTKTSKGVIWMATNGNGVFSFVNDSISAISRNHGLWSNYCYSILADSEDNIWIGHGKSFSRFNPESQSMKTYGAEFARGGTCNPGGMYESPDGNVFIGTTEGFIVYNRKRDNRKEVAPFNNITSIMINDVEYKYQPVIVLPYKRYRVTVNYSGVNFSDPDKVYYQTYLENFDFDWSKMTQSREVSYNLGDGKYVFKLLSVDENLSSREPLVTFDLIIEKPVYKKWWFIILLILALSSVIVFIIRQRELAQKKIQIYLEEELKARTSVVMKQKGEIELQNIEITDSINYAKRIQSSILPDITKLRETFKDAFIIFHPRDIVSGDFYWFDKLDDDRFILVCADSTGHGVPGAFMSMIGSTLLQDIVTRKKISQPSQVLSLLDKQIFSTLNQNVELGVSNDGMDMVVCEFNVKSRHIRFASAMRPIIIVLSGEPFYIKGNRSSVGGESVIEKYFDDQEYYLNEGDTIYLFSDGLPDQFGGIDGKKMKIARLKKLIEQISKMPMKEQEAAVTRFFDEWRGDYEQVDDILLMGVRV